MRLNNKKVIKLEGDASERKFYRSKNSIIIFSKKNKKKNLLIYDAINKILIKNKIKAPKLISQNYNSNHIQIEDFGNVTVYQKLKKNNKNKLTYYKKIIKLLNLVQKIKTKKIKTFLGSNYKVPKYSTKILLDETKLFLDWYVPKKIKRKKVIDMQIKKTGKLFAFCCVAPVLISNKNQRVLKFFEKIGYEIGLLFQITDDLIDYKGITKKAGKKTKKDQKKGKATLISLLGYKNTIKYNNKIKNNILKKLSFYGKKSESLKKTILFIFEREK